MATSVAMSGFASFNPNTKTNPTGTATSAQTFTVNGAPGNDAFANAFTNRFSGIQRSIGILKNNLDLFSKIDELLSRFF